MRRFAGGLAASIGVVVASPVVFGPGALVQAAAPLKVGTEFGVNSITERGQFDPDLAALPDGRVMVAFADGSFPNTAWVNLFQVGIRSQVVKPDRTLDGAPAALMPITPFPFVAVGYSDPQIATAGAGFLQTAHYFSEGLPSPTVQYVTSGSVGSPLTLPNTAFFGVTNGDVELLSSGNVAAVTVGQYDVPGDGSVDVVIDVLTAAGATVHDNVATNSTSGTAAAQHEASSAAFTGGVAVAFRDQQAGVGADDVTVVRTNNAGAPQNFQLLAIAGIQREPDIAANPDGSYVVAFVDENAPTSDGSGTSIRARYVSAAGVAGPIAQVNTTTAGDQTQPAITVLPDGRFFVAWTDASGTEGVGGSGTGVRGQLLTVEGGALVPDGAEFLVNTYTAGDQKEPAVVTTTDGRIAVAWQTASGVIDTDDTGISMQFLDPAETVSGIVAPGKRVCFSVTGVPGDIAAVNLTPVDAVGLGNGQLLSSDVATPPVASNVNFGAGTFDPNVALAPIGLDGTVCFVNSVHTSVHLVADHLGTIDAASYTPASPSGAPVRKVDTRTDGALGKIAPSGRSCFAVAGAVGDVAVVNLTPVEATAPGNGQLIASDLATVPVASNVNFVPGSVDPNVAVARIGPDGKVCFVNSVHASVHLVADHLGSIDGSAFTFASVTGAPSRIVDTRVGQGGARVAPSGRLCFAVAGSPGDVAVVNLTPVEAGGPGNGQLISSDVAVPPLASNVNFSATSIDPNVAMAPIGADGRVCYANSTHTSVHLIADHLGTIKASAYTLATPTGAPARKVDTR